MNQIEILKEKYSDEIGRYGIRSVIKKDGRVTIDSLSPMPWELVLSIEMFLL